MFRADGLHGSGRRFGGSVADAVKAVTPTAAVSYAADVMSDMCDRHIPPNVSLLTCEKRLPSPMP